MVSDKFIRHRSGNLHYATTGHGARPLLIFHGFGQDMSVFDFFASSLSSQYTFYVFDLYFHGKSTWTDGERTLSKQEWKEILNLFLQENNMQDFSIAGFSLGGKFALAAMESFPQRVKELFLIAPDGISTSFWYSLATYPILLRKFFRSMILHPNRFLSLAQWLAKSGLVDRGLIRFAEFQMNTEEKRSRVYYSWVVFRRLRFDPDHMAQLINSNTIKLTLITGKYDKVIAPKNMDRFLRKVKKYRFEILETGHSGLINQSLPYFTEG